MQEDNILVVGKKVDAYERGINLVVQLMESSDQQTKRSQSQLQRDMKKTRTALLMWAECEPLKAYCELTKYMYSRASQGSDVDGKKMMRMIGDFMLAVRKDLGHVDDGAEVVVSRIDLLGIFIQNVHLELKE